MTKLIKILLIFIFFISTFSQLCAPSQYFNGQHCAPCQINCLCSKQNQCNKCISGYTYDAAHLNCIPCPSASFYNPASNITNVGCTQCCYQVISTEFICSSCPSIPFVFFLGGQCLRIQGCIQANQNGICTNCTTGYYFKDGGCLPCHYSCLTCIDSTFCTACNISYYNATTNTNFSLCVACSAGCSKCSSATSCTVCMSGYVLSSNSCIKCSANCLTCSTTACTQCSANYTIINGTCYSCMSVAQGGSLGCATCQTNASKIKCLNCSSGYSLTSANTCISCSQKFSNSILCTQFQPLQCMNDYDPLIQNRYYLINGSCISNKNRCKTMSNTSGQCSQCYFQTGSYSSLVNGQCVQCSLTGCVIYSNTCSCVACQNGYQFVNSQCVPCQNLHCNQCQNNNKACEVCSPYYGLMASACVQCSQPVCLNCDGDISKCTQCQNGYYNGQGVCYHCQASCQTCTSSTNCSSCLPGSYLLPSNRCKSLPTDCLRVNQQGECIQCRYGYMIFIGNCIPCSPILFNLNQCEKFCPNYYTENQYQGFYAASFALLLFLSIIVSSM